METLIGRALQRQVMLGIVVSRADSASTHVGEQLLAATDWETRTDDSRPDGEGGGTVYRTTGASLREFDGLHVDLERPAEAFDEPRLVVFASRHAGETGPLLTAHHTGNVGPAEYGGRPDAFARACPNAHATVLDALGRYAPEGYVVGTECTHHGPTAVGAPSMFVEVGSDESQWDDPAAARAVARAILDLRGVAPDRPAGGDGSTHRHLVGLGGGHYAPRFERVIRETDWAVGHVLADWGLDAVTADGDDNRLRRVLDRAFTESRAAYGLVDGDPELEEIITDLGYRAVGETWVRETSGVALGFVRAVEEAVCPVAAGLRFGDAATDVDDGWTVETLPGDLLDEAFGIDRTATRAAVAGRALAFETDEGGTRPTGTVVLGDGDPDGIVDALVEVLRERYDSVERQADRLLAREEVFDPELARTLGVPEGPAFGRLADGQAVEVDGDRVPPAAVRREREREFRLS